MNFKQKLSAIKLNKQKEKSTSTVKKQTVLDVQEIANTYDKLEEEEAKE